MKQPHPAYTLNKTIREPRYRLKDGRKTPSERKAFFIEKAIEFSKERGFRNLLKLRELARYAGTSESLIFSYFKDINELRDAVIEQAILRDIIEILFELSPEHKIKLPDMTKLKLASYYLV